MKSILPILFISFSLQIQAQVTLDANGPGNTYELIASVLAPGENPIEAPGEVDGTCDNHSGFGKHITEVFDNELNDNVFKFLLHVNEDNDRCKNFDRQRNEIKTYDQSPDNLLGVIGETFEYKWKFKISSNFQASSKFTHLHQLKAVGGTEDSMPLITLTARKGSPDRLELRYAESTTQVTLTTVNLSELKGNWVEITETVTYGDNDNGKYQIIISNIDTGSQILNYEDNSIRMWKTNADFIRPKWGIYRSLDDASSLRDEEVLFANFSITENPVLSVDSSTLDAFKVIAYPNPTANTLYLEIPQNLNNYNVEITDQSGKVIKTINSTSIINVSELKSGVYFISIIDIQSNKSVKKMIKI